MAAGKYTIYIEQGSTFSLKINLKDSDSVAIDLTGYTGRGQIRKKSTDTTYLAQFDVSITDATNGEVTITLSAESSSEIVTTGASYLDTLKAYYDIEISKDEKVIRILNGICYISPEITK